MMKAFFTSVIVLSLLGTKVAASESISTRALAAAGEEEKAEASDIVSSTISSIASYTEGVKKKVKKSALEFMSDVESEEDKAAIKERLKKSRLPISKAPVEMRLTRIEDRLDLLEQTLKIEKPVALKTFPAEYKSGLSINLNSKPIPPIKERPAKADGELSQLQMLNTEEAAAPKPVSKKRTKNVPTESGGIGAKADEKSSRNLRGPQHQTARNLNVLEFLSAKASDMIIGVLEPKNDEGAPQSAPQIVEKEYFARKKVETESVDSETVTPPSPRKRRKERDNSAAHESLDAKIKQLQAEKIKLLQSEILDIKNSKEKTETEESVIAPQPQPTKVAKKKSKKGLTEEEMANMAATAENEPRKRKKKSSPEPASSVPQFAPKKTKSKGKKGKKTLTEEEMNAMSEKEQ